MANAKVTLVCTDKGAHKRKALGNAWVSRALVRSGASLGEALRVSGQWWGERGTQGQDYEAAQWDLDGPRKKWPGRPVMFGPGTFGVVQNGITKHEVTGTLRIVCPQCPVDLKRGRSWIAEVVEAAARAGVRELDVSRLA